MPDEDMRDKIAEVQRLAVESETESVSEDGAVRVVAGPGGAVKELDLRLSAFQMSGVELGEVVTQTIKTATENADRDMSDQAGRILGAVLGGDEEEQR
ncbi:YbaB/EbfC family nucleoid-associated protein [Glycomyces xiaoerkulensis]|uniref:YbaB/EbfC family nucleoid-associated protein n=1 Tax=Glycomyces xiaoerkulensis TaxID=2038139 RepID=UPI000C2580ED|nr:YbaB/EbfC family nucleoid-associated protein [Glycomyces xiaoerkulensis]